MAQASNEGAAARAGFRFCYMLSALGPPSLSKKRYAP